MNSFLSRVVIRHLPPTMTEEQFLDQISPLPDHNYFHYAPADLSLGPYAFCRATINFIRKDDIFIFKDKFDGYVFLDSKGNEYPATVEFSLYQKIPHRRSGNSKRKDPKCGTIQEDTDYKSFLETLSNQGGKNLPSAEVYLEEIEARAKDLKASKGKMTTPLIEFLKQKKAEKMKNLMRQKEERREERRKDKKKEEKRNRERVRERDRQKNEPTRETKEKNEEVADRTKERLPERPQAHEKKDRPRRNRNKNRDRGEKNEEKKPLENVKVLARVAPDPSPSHGPRPSFADKPKTNDKPKHPEKPRFAERSVDKPKNSIKHNKPMDNKSKFKEKPAPKSKEDEDNNKTEGPPRPAGGGSFRFIRKQLSEAQLLR